MATDFSSSFLGSLFWCISILLIYVMLPAALLIILTKWKRSPQKNLTPATAATQIGEEPNADSQLATLSTHLTSMMLPPFWPEHPEAWFTNVESQFLSAGITSESTKFQKVICKLPPEITSKVIHITCKPFQVGDYFKLKEAILGTFTKSRAKRWQELLSLSNIQNMKPTAILSKMRTLTLSTNPNECINIQEQDLKLHFLRALPSHMQALFSVISKNCTLDDLASQADTYYEQSQIEPNVAAVELRSQPAQSPLPHQPNQEDAANNSQGILSSIAASLDAISSKFDNKSRNRQAQPQNQRRPENAQLCYFHKRFGDRARKCAGPPCSKN